MQVNASEYCFMALAVQGGTAYFMMLESVHNCGDDRAEAPCDISTIRNTLLPKEKTIGRVEHGPRMTAFHQMNIVAYAYSADAFT